MLACDLAVPAAQMLGHQHVGLKRLHDGDPDSFYPSPKRPAHGPAPSAAARPAAPPTPSAAATIWPQRPTTTQPRSTLDVGSSATISSQPPAAGDQRKRTGVTLPPPTLPPIKRPRQLPAPECFLSPLQRTPLSPTALSPCSHIPCQSAPSTPKQPSPPESEAEEILPATSGPATPRNTPSETIPDVSGQLLLSRYLPPLAYNKIDLAPPLQKLLEEQLQSRIQLLQPSHVTSGGGSTTAGALIVYDPTVASVTADKLQQLAQQAAHLMRPRAAPDCTIEEIDGGPPADLPSGPPAGPPVAEFSQMQQVFTADVGMAGIPELAGEVGAAGGVWGAQAGPYGSQATRQQQDRDQEHAQQQRQQQQCERVGGLEVTELVDMDVD